MLDGRAGGALGGAGHHQLRDLVRAQLGCGGGEDYSANFAGKWQLVSIEGENALSEEDVQLMKDVELTVDLTLAEDGTCTLVMFGEDYGSGTWKAKSATECTVTLEGEDIATTLDSGSGRLSLTQGGDSLIFVRAE